jgi:hypothetical protein
VRVTSEGQSSEPEGEEDGEGSGVVATDDLPAFLIVDKEIAVDAVFLLLALLWAATVVEDCLMLDAEDLAVVFKVVGTWAADDEEAAAAADLEVEGEDPEPPPTVPVWGLAVSPRFL